MLVAGGIRSGEVGLDTAELFDPATGSFTPTGSLKQPRSDAATALLEDGRVLLAGGYDGTSALETAAIYDQASGTFTPTGSLPTARTSVGTAVLGDGRVLVAGGQGETGKILASAELFDPATGRFAPTGSMALVRYKTAAVPLPDGGALVLGGSDERDWDGQYDSAERYDPVSGAFVTAATMHGMRFKIAAAVTSLEDGTVLIAGSDPAVEIYNPQSDRCELTAGQVGSEYQYATATALSDGRALIAGGYDPDISPTARTWIYHPA